MLDGVSKVLRILDRFSEGRVAGRCPVPSQKVLRYALRFECEVDGCHSSASSGFYPELDSRVLEAGLFVLLAAPMESSRVDFVTEHHLWSLCLLI